MKTNIYFVMFMASWFIILLAILLMGCTSTQKDNTQDLFHALTFGIVPGPKMQDGTAYGYNYGYIPEPYGTNYMDHALYGLHEN